MRQRIFKYPLEEMAQTLSLPVGAKILCVQWQATKKMPILWALVNDWQESKVERTFLTFGTGECAPEGMDYIGTYQVLDGVFVWHVFEVPS